MLLQKGVEPGDVHIALERVRAVGVQPLADHQVECFRAAGFDIRSRRVEMRVRRHGFAFAAEDGEQDGFRRASLMRRQHVLEGKQVFHGRFEAKEGRTARVGFVPADQRGLLRRAHRGRARVGEQVDQHIV